MCKGSNIKKRDDYFDIRCYSNYKFVNNGECRLNHSSKITETESS